MTRKEFIKKIKYGDDIMFDVCGRHFVIFTWTIEDHGICICEQYEDGSDKYFQTIEDLLNGYLIDGHPIGDLVEEIVITDYTLASVTSACSEI